MTRPRALTAAEKYAYAETMTAAFAKTIYMDRVTMLIAFYPALLPQALREPSIGHGWIQNTPIAQDWLLIAEAGMGLLAPARELGYSVEFNEVKAGQKFKIEKAMFKLAQAMFKIPGASTYTIPPEWRKHPFGELFYRAEEWLLGTEFVSIAEGAKIAGISYPALLRRVRSGDVLSFLNPDFPDSFSRRRVLRRRDVTYLKPEGVKSDTLRGSYKVIE